jgi:hypothetical protein
MRNAMKRKTIGAQEVWYTRARFEWQDAAGMFGGHVWLCHCCGYWPSSDSTLPEAACYNCKEPWQTTADDPLATPVTVKVTDYGYERVAIGKPPNDQLTGPTRR